jgi:DNA-binding SARP family transcriptional activator
MQESERDAVARLRALLVDGRGIAEPRTVAAALAAVAPDRRHDPICRLADAVIARTGDLTAADPVHRAAAEAVADDPPALAVALSSWIGGALARRDVAVLGEIAEWGRRLDARGEHGAARAISATLRAAAQYAAGDFAAAEATATSVATDAVPAQLRGVIAWVRALSLQARGQVDATVALLDAEQPYLGVFDAAADLIRAHGLWISGAHDRVREMLIAIHARARQLGRQHDADFAAAFERLAARLDGEQPTLPPPALALGQVSEMVLAEQALALLPDEAAAAEVLGETEPSFRFALPALACVRYVLCPQHRAGLDEWVSKTADRSGALVAARALVARRAGAEVSVDPWQVRSLPAAWRAELAGATPTPSDAATVGVRVLGAVALTTASTELPIARERVRALFAVLALHRKVARERLAEMLWPGLAPGAAANNLRVTLTYARRALAEAGAPTPAAALVATRAFVALETPVDLWDLDRRAAEARSSPDATAWSRAAELARGRFAPDVGGGDWLDVGQRTVDATVVEVLWRAALAEGSADVRAAQAAAERALELDPWCEPAWDALVRALVASGSPTVARAAARLASERLGEIGIAPVGMLAELAG